MSLAHFLKPWSYRREAAERRLAELRQRDGDSCRRCRRPLRFDVPEGHDLSAVIEGATGEPAAGQCLTHRRCHSAGTDHTAEVAERRKRRNEAELLAQPARRRRKRAA